MAHTSGDGPVRVRVICMSPPNIYGNHAAEFGLQDKNQDVHPGQAQPTTRRGSQGSAAKTGQPDLRRHGARRALYLTWRYRRRPVEHYTAVENPPEDDHLGTDRSGAA
jgi:hypothetical protein